MLYLGLYYIILLPTVQYLDMPVINSNECGKIVTLHKQLTKMTFKSEPAYRLWATIINNLKYKIILLLSFVLNHLFIFFCL